VMFFFGVKKRVGFISIMPFSLMASALTVRRNSLRCVT
jgi:hypothetical protein